jgi:probable HAF family extracellular repeat protein
MGEKHLFLGKFHRGLLQLGLLLTLVAWVQGQTTTYQFYPSGTVGYGVDFPIALNNRGDVVIAGSQGSSFYAVPSPDTGGVGGGPVTGLNNSHYSAGWIPYSGGQNYAFFFDGSFTNTIRLSNGNSWAYAMNDSSEVVGAAVTSSGKTHAFAYYGRPGGSGGPPVDLGALSGGYSEARGINSSGQIVGDSSLGNGYFHAFLVTRGIMYDLGTLGGSNSYALGINDSGMIAGYGLTFGNTAIHPFLYNGSMHDLGTLGGTVAEATSINNMGQVVGWSYTAGNAAKHAFLSNGTTMVDLNTMVAGLSGWTLNSAWAINDLGEIAGYATDSSNNTQLYIMIPGFASNCTPNSYATQFADVSGDHLADQIVVNDAGIVVLRNTGLGMFGPAGEVWSTVPFYGAYHIDGLTVGNAFFADVDGDSKADAIVVNDTGITVRRSDGTKFLPAEMWASGLIARSYHIGGVSHPNIYFVDVNHDGAADAVSVDDNGVWVQLADKVHHLFGAATNWTGGVFYGTNGTFFADVTGDGFVDAIAVNRNIISGYPAISVRPSTGSSFGASQSFASIRYFPSAFADITGDGAADEIINLGSGGLWIGPSTAGSFNFYKNPAWSAPAFYGDFGTAYAPLDNSSTNPNTVDLIKLNHDGVYVEVSLGSSFSPYTVWSYPYGTYGNHDQVCH